jgi:hypothetical protein
MKNQVSKYLINGRYHKDWYTREPEKLYELLPEFEGLPILRAFAVTSMTTSIEANVCLAIKALLQIKRGQDFAGFLPNQILYLNLVKSGQDVPGRKIMNFIRALEGDKNAVVVDIWMCRAFGLINSRTLPDGRNYWKAPTNKEYSAIEYFCRKDAAYLGMEPRQYQSCLWAGIKKEQGMTTNVSWSDILQRKKGMFNY